MACLTLPEFVQRSMMPREFVDEIESSVPGWIVSQIESWESQVNARLRKRYDVPFVEPPEAFKTWIVRIVTMRAYVRRGVSPQDPQFEVIADDANRAWEEIKEAANSVDGLFDLPLRDSVKTSGIIAPEPFGYAEPSPYQWLDVQRDEVDAWPR